MQYIRDCIIFYEYKNVHRIYEKTFLILTKMQYFNCAKLFDVFKKKFYRQIYMQYNIDNSFNQDHRGTAAKNWRTRFC